MLPIPPARRNRQLPYAEFTGRAFMAWAHARGIKQLINDAGKPTQNAYVESFNGKFRDECLNEQWFDSLWQARQEIARWLSRLQPGATAQLDRSHPAGTVRRRPSPARWRCTAITGDQLTSATLDSLTRNWYVQRGQVSEGRHDVHRVFELVNADQADVPVQTMCRVLAVSASGDYARRDRAPSQRAIDNAVLTERIRAFHAESDATYGLPRVRAELIDQGVVVSRQRVARLMRAAHLRGVSRRRAFVVTTRRDKDKQPAPTWSNASARPTRQIGCGWPT